MKHLTQEEFTGGMERLFALFGKPRHVTDRNELNRFLAEYFKTVRKMDHDGFRTAVMKCRQNCRMLPMPCDLWVEYKKIPR
jgi:hypothetical protein